MLDMQIPETENKPIVYPLEFWKDYAPNSEGKFDEVEFVRWARKGTGATTEDKVARVKKANPTVWNEIEKYYLAWKKGQEVECDGMPLEVCNFITKEQIKVLKSIHLLSCEEFANCSDSLLDKIQFPGIRELRRKVKLFIDTRAVNSTTNQIAALQEKLEKLAKENEEQRELIDKLATAKPKAETDKPRRGRKPKAKIEISEVEG